MLGVAKHAIGDGDALAIGSGEVRIVFGTPRPCRLVSAQIDRGHGQSLAYSAVRIVARNGDHIREREWDATAPPPFLYLLPTPSQTLRPGLLLRGALGRAGARVPDGGWAVHRPPTPWTGLEANPHRRRRAPGDLSAQHGPDGGRQLLGSHARHQYRDRDAPQELRPPAETLIPFLRQSEDRAPRGACD